MMQILLPSGDAPAVSCDDERSMRKFFMGLSLLALGLALVLKLETLYCERYVERDLGQSPMGARHCPFGGVLM